MVKAFRGVKYKHLYKCLEAANKSVQALKLASPTISIYIYVVSKLLDAVQMQNTVKKLHSTRKTFSDKNANGICD